MKKDGTIQFGAFAPELKKQGWDDDDTHFQRDADAISRLLIRALIPKSVANKARDRLAKKIAKHNGLKGDREYVR